MTSMTWARRWTHGIRPLVPVALLFALLVTTLDAQSLWWDEGISLHLAISPWAEVVADRAANIHPPLYFFALKLWIAVAGRTPFAARYLSALAATLLPAAVYRWLRERFDARTGRAGALLVALAPPFIIYGQEVRAYALLPLLLMALLAQVWPRRGERSVLLRGWRPVALLAATQAAFGLTHYAGAIAVAWATAALLIQAARARSRRAWIAWLAGGGGVALLALPWALAVLATGAVGLRREGGLGNALAEPVPARYLLALLSIFHGVGLPQALGDPRVRTVAGIAGVAFVAALITALARPRRARGLWRLLLAWLLPLTAAPFIWASSPQAHPRYLLPFVMGGWLVAAVLVARRGWMGRVLLASLLVMCGVGLRAYLFDPAYARSDVRGAAAAIRERAQPGDVALIPHTDWSLEQYDVGAARIVMLPRSNQTGAVGATLAEIEPGARVFALDYERGALDPVGQVRAALAWGGYQVGRLDFHGVFLKTYEVVQAPEIAPCVPLPSACLAESELCMEGASVQKLPESGAALPVALCWQGAPTNGRYGVGLRLYAPSGALVAEGAEPLFAPGRRPTELWPRAAVSTYHTLPLPWALAPDNYRLEASLYRVDEPERPAVLHREEGPPVTAVYLGNTRPYTSTPTGRWAPPGPQIDVAPGVQLQGVRLDRAAVYPGQTFYVTSWWWVEEGASVRSVLRLMQGETPLDTKWALDVPYPLVTARNFVAYSALYVPRDAEAGPAQVMLEQLRLTPKGGELIPLGEIDILGGEHVFEPPPLAYEVGARANGAATLLGFDVPTTVVAGEPFTLTLVWEAGPRAGAGDWTVFTHLVGPDGEIAAQHDGKPAAGTRPILSWIPGEIVVDQHVLTWQREITGKATLRIGFYSAVSGTRLAWESGADSVELPLTIEVRGP